jgi:hypothetical protein
MKDKPGTAAAVSTDLQARLAESLVKYEQLRGFL